MAGKVPKLSPGAARIIDQRVDDIFDRLMARLLGHAFTGKRLYVAHHEDLSLPGIFHAAVTGEGGRVDPDILNGVAAIAKDYLDKHRAEAKAKTKHHVQALLTDMHQGRIDAEEFQNHVESEMFNVWNGIRSNVERVVETENEHAESLGIKAGIDQVNEAMGIEDPVIVFIPVKDDALCDECRRIHLLPDGVTPRAWYTSEVEAGYHEKGVDRPSWQKLHPHCRCTPATILPGFGFDRDGRVTYIAKDHDEVAYQRSYKRPPRGEEPRLKRLGKSEKLAKMARLNYDTPEFKAWFDGSKVVGPDGSPLRVYHGTSPASYNWTPTDRMTFQGEDFSQFNAPSYFTTNPTYASEFAQAQANLRAMGNGARVLPAHLAIRNPFDARGDRTYWKTFRQNTNQEMSRLQAAGHDGLVMHETDKPEHQGEVWVAFHPHQVKSVFNNRPTAHDEMGKHEPEVGEALEKALRISMRRGDFLAEALRFGWVLEDHNDHNSPLKHSISGSRWKGFSHSDPKSLDHQKVQYYAGQMGLKVRPGPKGTARLVAWKGHPHEQHYRKVPGLTEADFG